MTDPVIQPSTTPIPAEGLGSPFMRPELYDELGQSIAESEPHANGTPSRQTRPTEGEIDPEKAHDDPDPEGERELKAKPAAPKTVPKTVQKSPATTVPKTAPDPESTAKAKTWKEMNEERTRLKNEVVPKLETELTELRTRLSDYDRIKKEHEELDKIVKQGFVERDPRVIGPINQRVAEAVALAKGAVPSDQSERVASLLTQPDSDWRTSQLEEVISNLSPLRQGKLIEAVNQVDRASREKANLSSKGDEWLKERASEAMQSRQRQDIANLKMFDDLGKIWASGLPLYQVVEGNEDHNAAVKERTDMAKNIFSGRLQSREDLAKAAYWAAAAPGLLEGHKSLMQENARLKQELESLRGAEPGLDGGAGGPGEGETEDEVKPDNMSYGEWIAHQASKQGLIRNR